jgi:hypothetical protein
MKHEYCVNAVDDASGIAIAGLVWMMTGGKNNRQKKSWEVPLG